MPQDKAGAQSLRHNVKKREVTTMMTPSLLIFILGLGVLGVAVATALHDTWWLQRKAKKTSEPQEFLREAA